MKSILSVQTQRNTSSSFLSTNIKSPVKKSGPKTSLIADAFAQNTTCSNTPKHKPENQSQLFGAAGSKASTSRRAASKDTAQKPLSSLSVENERLRSQLAALKAKVAITKDLEAQVASLKSQLEAQNHTNIELELALEAQAEQMHAALKQAIREHQKAMNEKLREMEAMSQSQASTVRELRREKDELAVLLSESHDERHSVQKELNRTSKYMRELEERVFEANTQSLDLLKRVRDLEIENDTLKNYIIDLKARVAVYVPVRDDPVDMKVAEFINNYPDRNKLKIMFMRESHGVYEFGSKRINVRIEKGKILIRVGGGYMSIDEFLDQHTPVELEKLERRDPLKRFSEKLAMSKTVEGREVAASQYASSTKPNSPKKRI